MSLPPARLSAFSAAYLAVLLLCGAELPAETLRVIAAVLAVPPAYFLLLELVREDQARITEASADTCTTRSAAPLKARRLAGAKQYKSRAAEAKQMARLWALLPVVAGAAAVFPKSHAHKIVTAVLLLVFAAVLRVSANERHLAVDSNRPAGWLNFLAAVFLLSGLALVGSLAL